VTPFENIQDVEKVAKSRLDLIRSLFPGLSEREQNILMLAAFGSKVVLHCSNIFCEEEEALLPMLKDVFESVQTPPKTSTSSASPTPLPPPPSPVHPSCSTPK
jgi:hypothetical protein